MDVSDILRDRQIEPAGLQRMITASAALHGLAVIGLLIAPGGWLNSSPTAPRTVMTISLGGGSDGPQTGGLTTIGGRPVQVQTPPDEPARREALRAPAARAPEMTEPTPASPRRTPQAAQVKQAPDDARGRTPTRGAEVQAGSAIAETGARGQGFGLSTGGGPGIGTTLDVGDFCCPDYLVLMVTRIRSSWTQQAEVAGNTFVKFTIERDGRITSPSVEKSSGYTVLDQQALRAVVVTRQLPPLPDAFTNATLTVHLDFRYQR